MIDMLKRFHVCQPLPGAVVLITMILAVAGGGCGRNGESAKSGEKAAADTQAGEAKPNPDEVTITPEAVAKYRITVGKVEKRVVTPTIIAPARVAFNAHSVAHAGSMVHGRIVKLLAEEGATVKKGEELLAIESSE